MYNKKGLSFSDITIKFSFAGGSFGNKWQNLQCLETLLVAYIIEKGALTAILLLN